MLVELLTRMPIKSFSRSKSVSKLWRSLLSNGYVRDKLPLIVSGVLRPSNSASKNGPVYVLDFFPFRYSSTLIDCCNGLLLFYSSFDNSFYACNPTTKKYVSLPKPSKETELSVLAFDPHHSQHFKVVNFVGLHDQSSDLEVFDSESGYWVRRRVAWGIDTNVLTATMSYMDGRLYILAQPKQAAAVDLTDAACSLIELPEAVKKESFVRMVGGRLHYSNSDGNMLRIWMLKDEESGWLLKHCVHIKVGKFRVLALDPERDRVVYLWAQEKLIAYDVCEERPLATWDLGIEEKGYMVQVCVFPFSRCLENCLAESI